LEREVAGSVSMTSNSKRGQGSSQSEAHTRKEEEKGERRGGVV
jgi:hypothetical protein